MNPANITTLLRNLLPLKDRLAPMKLITLRGSTQYSTFIPRRKFRTLWEVWRHARRIDLTIQLETNNTIPLKTSKFNLI